MPRPRILPGLFALAGLLVLPCAVTCQDTVRRVTLAEALQAFSANNLALKIAWSEAGQVAGAARQSRAYFNPSLSFGRDDLGHKGEKFWEETIQYVQPLEWPTRTAAQRRAATHTISASLARFRADSLQLAFEVREAYAQAWLSEEAERTIGQAAAVIRSVADDAEVRLDAGDISAYEARRLRLERARAEQEMAEAGLRARTARRHLAALISPGTGIEEVGPSVGLEGVPPPVTREVALRTLPGRPDLEAAARELDAAEARVEVAGAAWIPIPTIGLGYRHHLDGFGGASVGFDLPLPLFDRGSGTREEAASESSAAAYRLNLRRLLAETDLLNAVDRYTASRARVEVAAEGLLADGESLLSSATAAYGENEMTLLELLDAASAFQDARLTALALRSEAWIAYYDLIRAMGTSPEEEQ
ncbi:MAG: TolC family protein [Gammaproteobacteria bacterium]|nr:TolC family protein [Gammaproteobacteria bacterium]MDE0248405.1 TolC family protein [Gammaproteobacteria bacterium]